VPYCVVADHHARDRARAAAFGDHAALGARRRDERSRPPRANHLVNEAQGRRDAAARRERRREIGAVAWAESVVEKNPRRRRARNPRSSSGTAAVEASMGSSNGSVTPKAERTRQPLQVDRLQVIVARAAR